MSQNTRGCGKSFNYKGYEEKQTDVSLGIQIIKDIFVDNIDRIILISADSDFIPVVKMALHAHIKVKVLKPLGQQKNYAYLDMIKKNKNYSVHDILEFHNRTSKLPDIIHRENKQPIKNPYLY